MLMILPNSAIIQVVSGKFDVALVLLLLGSILALLLLLKFSLLSFLLCYLNVVGLSVDVLDLPSWCSLDFFNVNFGICS